MSRRTRPRHLVLACLAALPLAGRAQDFSLRGYLDGRLVAAPAESSWVDGGLGKQRYGGGAADLHFGGAALVGTAQLTPALLACAGVQLHDTGHTGLDVLEA